MDHAYAEKKQIKAAAPKQEQAEQQGSSPAALRSGAAQPDPNGTGRRVDLPDAMRAKMENAFGADFSAVKLYESEQVAEAGAEAVTRGSDIAFAPGMLDFSSFGGQALLGHELSHVVSQARGEVPQSGGFLNDPLLEARADREGAMAAAGQQIAMPAAALSPVTAAAAAGPMQAKKKNNNIKEQDDELERETHYVTVPADDQARWNASNARADARRSQAALLAGQRRNDRDLTRKAASQLHSNSRREMYAMGRLMELKMAGLSGKSADEKLQTMMQDPEYRDYLNVRTDVLMQQSTSEQADMMLNDPIAPWQDYMKSYSVSDPFPIYAQPDTPPAPAATPPPAAQTAGTDAGVGDQQAPRSRRRGKKEARDPSRPGAIIVLAPIQTLSDQVEDMGKYYQAALQRHDQADAELGFSEYQRLVRLRMMEIEDTIRKDPWNYVPMFGSAEEKKQRLIGTPIYQEYMKLRGIATMGMQSDAATPDPVLSTPDMMQAWMKMASQMQTQQGAPAAPGTAASVGPAAGTQPGTASAAPPGPASDTTAPPDAGASAASMPAPLAKIVDALPAAPAGGSADVGTAGASQSPVMQPMTPAMQPMTPSVPQTDMLSAGVGSDADTDTASGDSDEPRNLLDDDAPVEMVDTTPDAVPEGSTDDGETVMPRHDTFEFASEKKAPNQLPSAGIGFILGMSNADDPKHGEAFRKMMEGLNGLAAVKGNRRHLGDMAFDAMTGNSYEKAIGGMKDYRKRLKREIGGNKEDRERQIAFLDDMIARAKADQQANLERQGTTLGAEEEDADSSKKGGINTVSRFSRGGKSAFFKPTKQGSNDAEREVMERVGIQPPSRDGAGNTVHDPHLANREIAYSRLGALLGSSVTLDAKKARLEKGGKSGVLTEEAKGKTWAKYNWSFFGLTPKDGSEMDEMAVMAGNKGAQGANLGDRMKAGGIGLTRKIHSGDIYSGVHQNAGEPLDVADPDFQRQMNEMFLLDTLAAHTDRHSGNFHVDRGADGKIGVKAIDNDLTFGSLGSEAANKAAFGKQGTGQNYGGLPAQMQIDANMAKKIRAVKRPMLDANFGDLLEKSEIDALWTRFEMMQEYIGEMERKNPRMLVSEWNEDTAKREMELAGGVGSSEKESKGQAGGYSGNNYYQRQLLLLNAAERRNVGLWQGALGR